MGMFDYFKSSFYLGPDFTNVTCQTKDLECTMSIYWLDPAGVLWSPDYTGTSIMEIIEENDQRYNKELLFLNYEMVPTGVRGKLKFCEYTGSVNIYNYDWTKNRKELCLLFKEGVLKTYEEVS